MIGRSRPGETCPDGLAQMRGGQRRASLPPPTRERRQEQEADPGQDEQVGEIQRLGGDGDVLTFRPLLFMRIQPRLMG
jgi:hypothetical protein